jgi:hypothetical protein
MEAWARFRPESRQEICRRNGSSKGAVRTWQSLTNAGVDLQFCGLAAPTPWSAAAIVDAGVRTRFLRAPPILLRDPDRTSLWARDRRALEVWPWSAVSPLRLHEDLRRRPLAKRRRHEGEAQPLAHQDRMPGISKGRFNDVFGKIDGPAHRGRSSRGVRDDGHSMRGTPPSILVSQRTCPKRGPTKLKPGG